MYIYIYIYIYEREGDLRGLFGTPKLCPGVIRQCSDFLYEEGQWRSPSYCKFEGVVAIRSSVAMNRFFKSFQKR